jgi:hypothetical protein
VPAGIARAPAPLAGKAEEERVLERGVRVERHDEHVTAVVEDLLSAVAVVVVDVDDRDPRTSIGPRLRGDGRVVQVAVARKGIDGGVMAGWARARVRDRFTTVRDRVPRGEGDVDRTDRGREGAGEDRIGVVRVPPELGDDVVGLDERLVADGAGVCRRFRRFVEPGVGAPALVRVFEEVDVLGRMHACDRRATVVDGRLRLTELTSDDRLEDAVDALGYLGRIDQLPAVEERHPGMMRSVRVGGDDQHPEAVPRH